MTNARYLITKTMQTFNVTFDIKQFNVKATNQFPIYINLSGIPPTSSKYDFVVQPNSDFTSPLISGRTITIFTTATIFTSPSEIILYSDKLSEAGNTPYLSNQAVSNLNAYPITVTPTASGLGLFGIRLPSIKFESLQPVYFVISGGTCCLLAIGATAFTNTIVGGAAPFVGDGLIAFVPYDLTNSIDFYLIAVDSQPITIKTVYFPTLLPKNSQLKASEFVTGFSLPFFGVAYAYVEPPAFYYDVILEASGNPIITTYDVTIKIEALDSIGNNILVLLNKNFAGSMTGVPTSVRLIEPTLVINPEYRFIRVTYTQNIIGSVTTVAVTTNIFNY